MRSLTLTESILSPKQWANYWAKTLRQHCSFYLGGDRWHTGYVVATQDGRVLTRAVGKGDLPSEDISALLRCDQPHNEHGRPIYLDVPYEARQRILRKSRKAALA
jgi:hypothetical protein